MSSYSSIVVHNIVSIYKQRFHKYPSLSELSAFEARIEETLTPSRISWRRSRIASCTLADHHEADVLRGEIKAIQTPAQTIDDNIDELKAKKAAIDVEAIEEAAIAAEERKLDARRASIQVNIDKLKHELDVLKAFKSNGFKLPEDASSEDLTIMAAFTTLLPTVSSAYLADDIADMEYYTNLTSKLRDRIAELKVELQSCKLNEQVIDRCCAAAYQKATYTINQELRQWKWLKHLRHKAQEADAAYINRICTYSTNLDTMVDSVSAWVETTLSTWCDSFPTTLSNMIKDVILDHTANNKDLFNGTVKTTCEQRISEKSYDAMKQWVREWQQYIHDEVLDNIPLINNVPVAEYILYTHIGNALNTMYDCLVYRIQRAIAISEDTSIKNYADARIIAQNLTSKINISFKKQGGWGEWCMDSDVRFSIMGCIQQLVDEWNATLDEPLPVELQEEPEEAEEATEQRTMEQFIKSLSDNEFTVDELTSLYNNFFGLDVATQRFSREPGVKDYFKTYRKTINTKKCTMYKLL